MISRAKGTIQGVDSKTYSPEGGGWQGPDSPKPKAKKSEVKKTNKKK